MNIKEADIECHVATHNSGNCVGEKVSTTRIQGPKEWHQPLAWLIQGSISIGPTLLTTTMVLELTLATRATNASYILYEYCHLRYPHGAYSTMPCLEVVAISSMAFQLWENETTAESENRQYFTFNSEIAFPRVGCDEHQSNILSCRNIRGCVQICVAKCG